MRMSDNEMVVDYYREKPWEGKVIANFRGLKINTPANNLKAYVHSLLPHATLRQELICLTVTINLYFPDSLLFQPHYPCSFHLSLTLTSVPLKYTFFFFVEKTFPYHMHMVKFLFICQGLPQILSFS